MGPTNGGDSATLGMLGVSFPGDPLHSSQVAEQTASPVATDGGLMVNRSSQKSMGGL